MSIADDATFDDDAPGIQHPFADECIEREREIREWMQQDTKPKRQKKQKTEQREE